MASNHKRNTDGLKQHTEKRQQATNAKVEQVIKELIKSKEKINFNTVAEKANVSKSYLYYTKSIRDRIELLRSQQEGLPSPKQVKREMTDASKDVLLAAKNKRIKELEEQVHELRRALERQISKSYG